LKKILKGLLLSVSVISFASSGWSAWWMYENNNYQLYSVAQPAKKSPLLSKLRKPEMIQVNLCISVRFYQFQI